MLIIIKTLKCRFFDHALTQERIETFFSGVQPERGSMVSHEVMINFASLCTKGK